MAEEFIYDTDQSPSNHDDTTRADLQKHSSRIGFSLFALIFVMQGAALLVASVLAAIDMVKGTTLYSSFSALLIPLSEAFLLLAIAVGFLVLRPIKPCAPEKKPITVGFFLMLYCICFGMSRVGSTVSSVFLSIWNAVMSKSAGTEIADALAASSGWMTVVFVGIIAPILEELFFRKLVIDRLRVFGDKVAIFGSAVLFALFHVNFSQLFYAFGVGLIFGYLYCRSGRLWHSILLHALFNLSSGILASKVVEKLYEAFAVFVDMSEEEIANALPELLTEIVSKHGAAILLSLLYFLVTLVLSIVGIILFCMNISKIKTEKGERDVPLKSAFGPLFVNVGMIFAILLSLALMLLQLMQ